MSATNRGGKRRESDYYPTPDALALRIVARVTEEWPRGSVCHVLEPSAGSGAFVRACQATLQAPKITAVEPSGMALQLTEIRPDIRVCSCGLEEYSTNLNFRERFDLIIGNPPYSLAEEHIRICLGLLAPRGRLAFLLRLAFLETPDRAKLFREFSPARVIALSERPSFCWSWGCTWKTCGARWKSAIGEKPHNSCPNCGHEKLTKSTTDSTAYAVFEWVDGYKGPTRLEWM